MFKEGGWVYLRLQPYRQHSVLSTSNSKLSPRYAGPYQIKHKISDVAYSLDLSQNVQIHNTLHVSTLKPVLGRTNKLDNELSECDRPRQYSFIAIQDITKLQKERKSPYSGSVAAWNKRNSYLGSHGKYASKVSTIFPLGQGNC